MSLGTIEFRTLGPIELVVDGRPVALQASKQQTLLALLLLRANTVTERDWLVDQLWSGGPPSTAIATLRGYIYQLRKHLNGLDGIALRSRTGGYALEVPTATVDAYRFEALAADGRQALQHGRFGEAAAALRDGLTLWRGEAFAGIDVPAVRDRARLLDEMRLEVIEHCMTAELESGALTTAVAELEGLTSAFPLREGLWRLLMLSLYRAGRQGEAVNTFQRLYRLLDEELGIRPSAPLEQLHQQMLTGDPQLQRPAADPRSDGATADGRMAATDQVVPRQLPSSVAHFTGREAQLAQLHRLMPGDTTPEGPGAVSLAVITGTAGIGKTTLAVHWGHQIAEHFPDGQLYVNLRGFCPEGHPTPAEVLRTLIEALGAPPERLPADTEALAGLYRSLLAGKRILVVLDSARDVDQVRPLLPGTSGSFALITSRDRLPSLVAQGAQPITLTHLNADDAGRFLTRRIRKQRTDGEPEAVNQIIDACAGLPLALAIVAARAAANPEFPLAALAADLHSASNRLDALTDPDPATDVRAVFASSYHALSADAARLFRLLSLHPGPDLSCAAAASLVGVAPHQALRLLTELTCANLLIEQTPSRFAFHDLLRAYAVELTDTDDPQNDRNEVATRIFDHYLHTAYAGNLLIYPTQDPIVLSLAGPGVTPERLVDDEAAMAWFATEHAVLLATINHAEDQGFDTHCWQLAWTLSHYLHRRGSRHDLADAWQTALKAARRLGDVGAQVRGHRVLAQAYHKLGRIDEACSLLEQALILCEVLDDRIGRAHTYQVCGRLWRIQGRDVEALAYKHRALELYEAAGHRAGQAAALNSIGWHHALLGDHQKALGYCERAMVLLQDLDDRSSQAITWDSFGYIHRHLGHHTQAVGYYERAVELCRELGFRSFEADTLANLGDTQHEIGDFAAARRTWQEALAIFEELDHPGAEGVRAKLNDPD